MPPAHPLADIGFVDVRGTRPGGRRYRFLAFLGELFEYDNLAQEDAALFDRMLDGACYVIESRQPR